jgi:hypothetical protein
MKQVNWTDLKAFANARGLSIQWVDLPGSGGYWLAAFDGPFEMECTLDKGTQADDVTDFETNYKALGNQKLGDPIAFAKATHRTKLYATSAPVDCAADGATVIDYVLAQELWMYGGEIIVEGAKFGDWVSAEIYDVNSIIPEPYRPALCEAWPSVATYIIKRFIRPEANSSVIAIDTRPLIAKVTAGLALRVTYNATSETGTRKVVINYFSAKKL